MRIADISQRLADLGALPVHRQRVLRHWTHALPHTRNKRQPQHWLPKAVVDALPALDAMQTPINALTELQRKLVADYLVPVGRHSFDLEMRGPNQETLSRNLDIDVSGKYMFAVAIADLTLSGNSASGSIEPLATTLVRRLAASYQQAGLGGDALRLLDRHARLLAEAGAAPDAALQRWRARLLAGEPLA